MPSKKERRLHIGHWKHLDLLLVNRKIRNHRLLAEDTSADWNQLVEQTTQYLGRDGFDPSNLPPASRLHYELSVRVEGISERGVVLIGVALLVTVILASYGLIWLFKALLG